MFWLSALKVFEEISAFRVWMCWFHAVGVWCVRTVDPGVVKPEGGAERSVVPRRQELAHREALFVPMQEYPQHDYIALLSGWYFMEIANFAF